jgi:hypothetical protein
MTQFSGYTCTLLGQVAAGIAFIPREGIFELSRIASFRRAGVRGRRCDGGAPDWKEGVEGVIRGTLCQPKGSALPHTFECILMKLS